MPPQSVTNPVLAAPPSSVVMLTPNVTPWANSAWVELIASTAAASILTGIVVHPFADFTFAYFEIDIGVGAAGFEVPITTFRGLYGNTSVTGPGPMPSPIGIDNIGASVRVSARLRKSGVSAGQWKIAIAYYQKPLVGTFLSTAKPQQVYPPAADNVTCSVGATPWGSSTWTTIIDPTAAAIVLTGIVPFAGEFPYSWEFDVGIGSVGVETVLTTIRLQKTGIVSVDGPSYIPFYEPLDNIPVSSRLSVRTRTSNTLLNVATCALTYIEKPL